MAVLATPHMMSVLSTALFVQADVTFPGTKAFPYLLNMVTFNHGSLEFEVVARVLLSKISAKAYKEAFGKVFGITTQLHPEFENGANVLGRIVDFSDAQYTGLAHNIGDRASEVIRGCSVHYKRNVDKVAQKVCQNEPSRQLFQKIAYKIQFLERQEDVCLAFDILTGTKELQEAEAFIHLTEEELSVNTEKWVGAVNWANWWQRPRIVKMFTKCFKDMTDAVWGQCPNTTNAIESHNKISNAKTTLLVSALAHFYRVDKRTTLRMLAAEMGIRIGDTMATKKRKKRLEEDADCVLKRKWKLTRMNRHPHPFNIYLLRKSQKTKMEHLTVLHQPCLVLKMLRRKVLPQIPQRPFNLPQKIPKKITLAKRCGSTITVLENLRNRTVGVKQL